MKKEQMLEREKLGNFTNKSFLKWLLLGLGFREGKILCSLAQRL